MYLKKDEILPEAILNFIMIPTIFYLATCGISYDPYQCRKCGFNISLKRLFKLSSLRDQQFELEEVQFAV